MTTEWFTRRPGYAAMGITFDVSEEVPGMVIISDGTPDWIRLPADLGGERRRVDLVFKASGCPCGKRHRVRHIVAGDISVAECADMFRFYSTPQEEGSGDGRT